MDDDKKCCIECNVDVGLTEDWTEDSDNNMSIPDEVGNSFEPNDNQPMSVIPNKHTHCHSRQRVQQRQEKILN